MALVSCFGWHRLLSGLALTVLNRNSTTVYEREICDAESEPGPRVSLAEWLKPHLTVLHDMFSSNFGNFGIPSNFKMMSLAVF
jgi:hypothetical protein